ncbi:MAG: 30S ribosomal protein S4 [Actinomycetaceae bacterium]|nr:30S ribosomal protein S4 [Actinomycetaceae bacterium]MDY6083159.1 30S ribosomal protein S4 [Actinomycetaceae bacterium]
MSANRSRKQVRMSRALGIALTPKAERIMAKRPYRPGEHGRGRTKDSDYSVRLKEKQRLRAQYGIREAQMRRVWDQARRMEGAAGDNLVQLLEQRLDALVLRAGFARTTAMARQIVTHRHVLVDGKLVDRPSYRVKPGQVIQIKPKSQSSILFLEAAQGAHRDVLPKVPEYLDVDLEKLKATLVRLPKLSEVPITIDIQMVVEHYSR